MEWQALASVADIYAACPDRMRDPLAALDLRRPGLAEVSIPAHAGATTFAWVMLPDRERGAVHAI